ncbi:MULTISPECIES: type III secretion system export apparatus subunit SctT [Pseudomonas]|uniref:type III secretion system export apparatus subunit SctT n=1 Tax=Pseudomonas TaxID=286 RepID=UPI000F5730B1|nr:MULTISPECIES: type III secretion system export apparatus subunit SctT [Pseudomonas]AZF15585.1 Type III secretion inner membrane protein (YscT,HrcT,SpaR,EscT,EpaR1) [Pseudomonas sp. R3-18-08]AZF26231.1 Type III secretion inner membrane protein (YscT,HrcT,SpaR,EscT,EpaR1) [Pseudomonas sp. R2-60-08W]AZF31596.1 Type III secretion inner membrane protein (YscT,HrcT,SpaR,EscT,EpaR1) [Pseudomonas sp. R4-35-07]AZF36871.1 Type III secretion inner membrane protein (YscT,HrcT,SpaR,EscT,EpaR1) [Pseudomon
MVLPLFFDLHLWLAGAALGFARLAPVFFMLPFLNSGVLSGVARNAVIVLVAFALWPYSAAELPAMDSLHYMGLMLREAGVGVLLGCLLCWPFWALHALGCLIDNQRGAMLSSTVDPANGVDTSELANFFNLFAAAVYLEGGGLLLMVETLKASYQLCDPLGACLPGLPPVLGMLDGLVTRSLLLSAPVVTVLLLSEVVLGLLSRFAPQMNAFSVSLTIKGSIALLMVLLYFGAYLPDEILRLAHNSLGFASWIDAGVD